MTVPRTAVTVLMITVTGFGLWYGLGQRKTSAGRAAATATAAGAAPTSPRATKSHAGIAESHVVTSDVPSPIDYAKAFRESTNYRSFILSALPAAQSGDPDAQYYLHAALAYCDESYSFYFRPRGKVLTLDEAIAVRSELPGPSMTEAIKRAYSRCHEVNEAKDSGWGTAQGWLSKATDAGQPVAQMETAQKIFLRPLVRGGVSAESEDPAIAQGTYIEARSLVRAAIESKNPQAIFDMGGLQGFLQQGEPQEQMTQDAITWEYVACLRGFDCGVDAEWYRQFCLSGSNCLPGESGVDYLRRTAPMLNVLDLEQRAYDLNAKIDAGAWDELGIGG